MTRKCALQHRTGPLGPASPHTSSLLDTQGPWEGGPQLPGRVPSRRRADHQRYNAFPTSPTAPMDWSTARPHLQGHAGRQTSGPSRWRSWAQPVRQADLETPLGLGGWGQLHWNHPPLFVNLVYCKSNIPVFFTLLLGWAPRGCRHSTGLEVGPVGVGGRHRPGSSAGWGPPRQSPSMSTLFCEPPSLPTL